MKKSKEKQIFNTARKRSAEWLSLEVYFDFIRKNFKPGMSLTEMRALKAKASKEANLVFRAFA